MKVRRVIRIRRRGSRAIRLLVGTIAAVVTVALMAGPASAYQSGTVTLSGYGAAAEQVYTLSNADPLFGVVGNHNGQEDIFISIFPTGETWERWDIYLIPPPGPLVPGTYTAPGGFGSPGLVLQHWGGSSPWGNYICEGGSFTLNSMNRENPWGLEFDVSWSQNCNGVPVSGHAVFVAVVPPDTTPPAIDLSWGGWVVAETTGEGTVVNFDVPVTDDRDPNPVVVCDPPFGTYFPLEMN
jgi:hypothetical protein